MTDLTKKLNTQLAEVLNCIHQTTSDNLSQDARNGAYHISNDILDVLGDVETKPTPLRIGDPSPVCFFELVAESERLTTEADHYRRSADFGEFDVAHWQNMLNTSNLYYSIANNIGRIFNRCPNCKKA